MSQIISGFRLHGYNSGNKNCVTYIISVSLTEVFNVTAQAKQIIFHKNLWKEYLSATKPGFLNRSH